MNAGMNGMGMQSNMMNSGMNAGMNGMNMNGPAAVTGRDSGQYGAPGMKIKCSSCGWEPEDPSATPKFCPNCGDRFDGDDMSR